MPRHLRSLVPPAAPAAPAPELVVIGVDALRRVVAEEVRRALEEREATPAEAASDWIDSDAAASILGVGRDYLRRIPGLPRYGSPRRPRFRRSEIEAFVRDRAGAPLNRHAG